MLTALPRLASDREDAEHTYEGLIRACEWLGGVPADMLVDNQKAAVLEHRSDGVRSNPRFIDLARQCGFMPRACRPARARTKGKDERMVGSIKDHFFVRHLPTRIRDEGISSSSARA